MERRSIYKLKHSFELPAVFFFLTITIISTVFFSCGGGSNREDAPGGDTPTVSGLPDNSFYCLRADSATVNHWIEKQGGGGGGGGNNKHSRIVFSYYWPDRTKDSFTLIAFRNDRANPKQFAPQLDTLKTLTPCAVSNLGNSIVLGSNQIPVSVIERVWNYDLTTSNPGRTRSHLRFTPLISVETDPSGNMCCRNNLIYKIDLILDNGNVPSFSPENAYESGYSNPSPPKEPSN